MPLVSGTRVGPYEILAPLGAGGMGEVYKARDTRLGRDVAIKLLSPQFIADAERLRRFTLEARTAGSLNHPNVMSIYDVGDHEGAPYLICELLEGETLRARLERGTVPVVKAIEYTLGIAAGLSAAHAKGIIHRDLKPENIFLTRQRVVKILDFGIARLSQGDGRRGLNSDATSKVTETIPGTILGTAAYMAPEQVQGEPCDQRSDIFSLGAIVYEMLSGKRAFFGDSAVETMTAVLKTEPRDLEAPQPLVRIVRRCLEKNPADRFQSASDLAFALDSLSTPSVIPAASSSFAPAARTRRIMTALAIVALLGMVTAGAFWAGRRGVRSLPPSFHQMTFRRGSIFSARFAPDGRTVVYGAKWEGNPLEIFMTRPESPESRRLGFSNAEILAISVNGEMALSLGRHYAASLVDVGTLARMPLAGGAPRELVENVQEADWSPDGATLAAVLFERGRSRIEFPIGKVLHQSAAWASNARISPKGDLVAFIEHPRIGDDSGSVAVVDVRGVIRTISKYWSCIGGLAWSPNGEEIWFTAARTGNNRVLQAVSLTGRERLVVAAAGALILHDISRDGLLLVTRDHPRTEIAALAPGEVKERDLSWLDNSAIRGITSDGKTILFDETGEGGGPRYSVYVRKTDGSPAVRLGDGGAFGLSPDGKWALSVRDDLPQSGLVLLPVGTGAPKPLARLNIHFQFAAWFPDGKRILILGSELGHGAQLYVQDVSAGHLTPITPEGFTTSSQALPTPDGRFALARGPDGQWKLFPVDGGAAFEASGITTEVPVQWDASGGLYMFQPGALPSKVYRLNLATRRKQFWKELSPADSAGAYSINRMAITPDGKAYAYNYRRLLSNLYLVEGVH